MGFVLALMINTFTHFMHDTVKKHYIFWLKSVMFLIWGLVVVRTFFQSFPLVNLLEVFQNGSLLFFLLLVVTALGKRVLRVLNIHFSCTAEEWSFSFGLGSGGIVALIFGLAALHTLHEVVVVGVILLVSCLVYSDIRGLCLEGFRVFSSVANRTFSLIELMFVFLIGIAGVSTFLAAATPPFFYDALVYHLAVPQQYLLAHGFHEMPHHHFSNFPMNAGMLFTVGMSFSGGMLAKLLSWIFAPMTALAVYGFAKTRWGRQTAVLAAAILFLVPGILTLSILTSVDLGVMFYSFLSLSALITWFETRQNSWFFLAGILCGFALGTKYTAFVITFVTLELVVFLREAWGKRYSSLFIGLKKMLLLGLLALCCVSPWLMKNEVYTGNPIYPFFNSWFSTHASPFDNYDQVSLSRNPLFVFFRTIVGNEPFNGRYWRELLSSYVRSPWTVTMSNTRAAGKTGIVFLLCFPFIFFVKKLDNAGRYCLGIAAVMFFLWLVFFSGNALRYVFQMFPPLSLATASMLDTVPRARISKHCLFVGVGLLLSYHLCMMFQEFQVLQPYSYLFRNQPEERFLVEHGVNYYPVVDELNQKLPEGSRILYVGELRGYYCEKEFLLATNAAVSDDEKLLRRFIAESQDVLEVLQKLRQQGITHLLVNFSEIHRLAEIEGDRESYFDFQTAKDTHIFHTLFSRHFQLLFSQHQVNVYEVLYDELHP